MEGTTLLELTVPLVEHEEALGSSSPGKGDIVGLTVSQSLVVNRKLIDLAASTCEGSLVVALTGPLPQGYFRKKLQDMYNDLWDACLDAGRVALDCIVLGQPVTQVSFDITKYLESESRVVKVISAGGDLDSYCSSMESIASVNKVRKENSLREVDFLCIANKLSEELNGIPYVVFDNPSDELPCFKNVVMGGTFDHFHNGHKKLLTIAVQVAEERLVIGITSRKMLGTKSHGDLIETYEERSERVFQFCKMLNPLLRVEIAKIDDPFGPSIVDENLQGVVVSSETLKGARLINEKRAEKNLSQLGCVVALRTNVYPLSSSFVREWKHRASSGL